MLLGAFLFLINSGGHTYSWDFLLVAFTLLPDVLFLFSLSSLFRIASFRFEVEGAAGDNVCGFGRSHGCRDSPSFPVTEHIYWNGDRINGQQFPAICLAGHVRKNCDVRTWRMCNTAVGPWISHGDTRVDVGRPTCCVISLRRTVCMSAVLRQLSMNDAFGDILRRLRGSTFSGWLTDPGEVISFFHPYDQTYFFTN